MTRVRGRGRWITETGDTGTWERQGITETSDTGTTWEKPGDNRDW